MPTKPKLCPHCRRPQDKCARLESPFQLATCWVTELARLKRRNLALVKAGNDLRWLNRVTEEAGKRYVDQWEKAKRV